MVPNKCWTVKKWSPLLQEHFHQAIWMKSLPFSLLKLSETHNPDWFQDYPPACINVFLLMVICWTCSLFIFPLIHFLLCFPPCLLFLPSSVLSAILVFFWQGDLARYGHVFSLRWWVLHTQHTKHRLTEKTWEWEYYCISVSTVETPIHLGTMTCLILFYLDVFIHKVLFQSLSVWIAWEDL